MQVASITRKFVLLTGNKEKVELEDMNPDLGNEQIMEHYSMIYPELTNANLVDKGIIDGFHVINFESLAGTKG